MIAVETIQKLVQEKIDNTDFFIVDIKVDTANNISIFVDSKESFDVQTCVDISKHVENSLDRDEEDFALEVSSAGIGYPFKVIQQYEKAVGKTIEVLFSDGKKLEGTLIKVNPESFELEYQMKEKPEGAKRPKLVTKQQEIKYDSTKSVIETIKF